MARQATQIGRILVGCVRSAPPEPATLAATFRGVDLRALPAAASFHRVVAFVRDRLRTLPYLDEDVAGDLERLYQLQVRDHLRSLHDLARVGRALDQAGVPWLVVKGPVLAQMYQRDDQRSYADLDLVVPGLSLRDAIAVLDDGENTIIDRNWALLRRNVAGEVHLRLAHGTTADLHWHLLNRAPLRRAFQVDMRGVFERARPVRLGAIQARTLGRADTLVHLGLHGCLSGGNRLVWLKDIERCLADEPPNWDEIVARAHQWRAHLALSAMLARAQRVLSVEVPTSVGRSLAPDGRWRALVAAADRVAPLERSMGRRSLPRMMALSMRADIGSSLASLTRHAGAWAAGGGLLVRQPVPGPNRDQTSPGSVLHPAGGEEDRSAYLAAVAGECGGSVR